MNYLQKSKQHIVYREGHQFESSHEEVSPPFDRSLSSDSRRQWERIRKKNILREEPNMHKARDGILWKNDRSLF